MPDRNGKIFYTSITSLSHISKKNGHKVFRFNAAFKNIHACTGCNACGMNGPCVFKDDIERELMPELLDSDMIVLVTPLYYYDMSAQLKTVIDRMHGRLRSFDGKKSILMATAWNSAGWTFDALVDHYDSLVGRIWARFWLWAAAQEE